MLKSLENCGALILTHFGELFVDIGMSSSRNGQTCHFQSNLLRLEKEYLFLDKIVDIGMSNKKAASVSVTK